MHPYAAAELAERGIDTGEWAATRTSPQQLLRADLILTATAAHRGAVIGLQPRALQRTFTLFQFARLAEPIRLPAESAVAGPAGGATLLNAARAMRSELQPAEPGAEDLADPIGEPPAAFARTAALITAATTAILGPLAQL
jgi:protein-tyrosine phosphatase